MRHARDDRRTDEPFRDDEIDPGLRYLGGRNVVGDQYEAHAYRRGVTPDDRAELVRIHVTELRSADDDVLLIPLEHRERERGTRRHRGPSAVGRERVGHRRRARRVRIDDQNFHAWTTEPTRATKVCSSTGFVT